MRRKPGRRDRSRHVLPPDYHQIMKNRTINTTIHRILVILLLGAAFGVPAEAVSFCSMSGDDLLTVLSASPSGMKASGNAQVAPAPEVTASDMMTMVYGMIDPSADRGECLEACKDVAGVVPEDEGEYVWLDEGYALNYRGMQPEVAAVARFEDGESGEKVRDYCFFFQFPYKEKSEQCEFSETLLRDIHSVGGNPGVNVNSDDLYDVVAVYGGGLVDVRLVDDADASRYVVILSVEPGAFGAEDDVAAM